MSKIPEPTHNIAQAIYAAYEAGQELPRPHLGCSMIGHHCDRYLWISFRWAVIEKFNGRILRLFQRGHEEEVKVIADLKRIGMEFHNTGDQQTRVDFGNHVSGSLDGIITYGVPGAKQTQHVFECKTHSKKSFDDLAKNGVEKSKPMHYAQMQVYMMGTSLERALYVAVCKDNDDIYTERVKYEPEVAKRLIDRAHRITSSDRLPEPCSTDPSWYQCKYCPAHEFCFETKLTKEASCRTCANSTAMPDSTFKCDRWNDTIPIKNQHTGCDSHVLHPDLVPWQRADSSNQWQAVYIVDGKKVANGEPSRDVYSSKELIANAAGCAMDDDFMRDSREFLGCRVVG